MTAIPVLIIIIAIFLWLLRFRFRDRFLRAYGLFFLILLIYASNKEFYGISPAMSEGAFSPLSLVRWGLLAIFVWYAWQMRKPASFGIDVAFSAIVVLLLCDMMISSVYADSFSYSFMRALSFALLAFAVMGGMAFYLFSSVNCLRFFHLNYCTAWIVLAPLMVLLFLASGYGVTIIMGQYAGFFGNQNMFGTFSALITPYVLFHWRAVAQKRREKWLDICLLLLIFAGLWLSGSRNGMSSCLLAIVVYFFVVNLQSRLKIFLAGICLAVAFTISPTLKTDLTQFVRKGTDKTAQVTDFSSQIFEERRYEMWTGVWPMFWKQKLTGYGFASSHLLVFPFTKDEAAGRALHNSYLEIFGDLGLPGLILLLLILYRVGTKAFVLLQQRGEYLERNINAVFIAVFVAGSANAFFESWMFSVGNLTSLMYWGSIAGVIARRAWRPVEVRETRSVVRPELRYTAARTQN
ncbi:MAG: O-antigen ligase family protein [Acidobacteria bacterium]|nr:O-antigen ligase family protein [Acidobacteriota bacterium]